MPHNGDRTFRHKGRTFDMMDIFRTDECVAEKYTAFGRETTFLTKVLKLGMVNQGGFVFDPSLWRPIPNDLRPRFPMKTHFRVSKRTGRVFFGNPRTIGEGRR